MPGIAILGFCAILAVSGTSSLVATDVIRAGDSVTVSNSSAGEGNLSTDDQALIGRVVRRTVYVGQAIRPDNTESPRLVGRNQVVSVRYIDGPLEITISGRALGEGGEGDTVEVMNLKTRQLIQGVVTKDGWILAR